MSRLSDAELAIQVVDAGSFSGAAEASGISQPAVSRRIRALEDRLGARLFERTTRHVRPTDAGLRYVARARRALLELAEAESDVSRGAELASGVVRVSAASAFARNQVVPRLAAFHATYPEVRLELDLVDRYVDLVEEGYDLAIRVGAPRSTGLVARKLGSGRMHLCAAPSYLRRNPAPRAPRDLSAHSVLVMKTYTPKARWSFVRGRGGRREVSRVRLEPVAIHNDAESLRLAVRAGVGVSILPDYLAGDDLRRGRLVELLPSHRAGSFDVHALFTERRHLRPSVRAFVSFLGDAVRW